MISLIDVFVKVHFRRDHLEIEDFHDYSSDDSSSNDSSSDDGNLPVRQEHHEPNLHIPIQPENMEVEEPAPAPEPEPEPQPQEQPRQVVLHEPQPEPEPEELRREDIIDIIADNLPLPFAANNELQNILEQNEENEPQPEPEPQPQEQPRQVVLHEPQPEPEPEPIIIIPAPEPEPEPQVQPQPEPEPEIHIAAAPVYQRIFNYFDNLLDGFLNPEENAAQPQPQVQPREVVLHEPQPEPEPQPQVQQPMQQQREMEREQRDDLMDMPDDDDYALDRMEQEQYVFPNDRASIRRWERDDDIFNVPEEEIRRLEDEYEMNQTPSLTKSTPSKDSRGNYTDASVDRSFKRRRVLWYKYTPNLQVLRERMARTERERKKYYGNLTSSKKYITIRGTQRIQDEITTIFGVLRNEVPFTQDEIDSSGLPRQAHIKYVIQKAIDIVRGLPDNQPSRTKEKLKAQLLRLLPNLNL